MTDHAFASFARIDKALERIEAAIAASGRGSSDARYQQLRARTQAALAELDAVIARTANGGR